MNERVAKVGGQVKQAFGKVGEVWNNQEPKRRKMIIYAAVGLIVFALGLVIILNVLSGRYVVLYDGMSQEDSVRAISVLETAGVPIRLNGEGQLEVPTKQVNRAMAQLSLEGIPNTTLDYNVFAKASGLTTTETEKREYLKMQWQDRLQNTIKQYDGVQNAIVTLNINTSSTRAWDINATKNTGSVSLTLKEGYTMSPQQVQAIRSMVGASVGIAPEEVVIVDQHGTLLAAAGEMFDAKVASTPEFVERMGLEAEVEKRLVQKVANLLSLPYPDSDQWRISCTIELDFNALVEEIKTYIPLDGTIHGVVDSEELQAQMGLGQFAEGVPGETDNTDVPIYVDLNGDGVADSVDYARYRDFAVSYTLQQITRDGPKQSRANISVAISDNLSPEEVQQVRQMVAQATGIPVENVGVTNFVPAGGGGGGGGGTGNGGNTLFGIDILYIYIASAAVLALILVLVTVLALRRRAAKRRLAEEEAALLAEQEEAARIQAEIEERKQQLKNAAIGDHSENAITNEVREFARNNPEITANLLRNWLKDGD